MCMLSLTSKNHFTQHKPKFDVNSIKAFLAKTAQIEKLPITVLKESKVQRPFYYIKADI